MATTASPRQPRPAPSARSTASRRRSVPTYFNVVYALSGDYYESTVLLYHHEECQSTVPVPFQYCRVRILVIAAKSKIVLQVRSCVSSSSDSCRAVARLSTRTHSLAI